MNSESRNIVHIDLDLIEQALSVKTKTTKHEKMIQYLGSYHRNADILGHFIIAPHIYQPAVIKEPWNN